MRIFTHKEEFEFFTLELCDQKNLETTVPLGLKS